MTQTDRSEVREMLHGILSGWQAETVAREELTNLHLKNIEDHFARLNGSVTKHEKVINENLPHSVSQCVQAHTIVEIRDNMITSKALKSANRNTVVLTASIFTVLFILFQVITKILTL